MDGQTDKVMEPSRVYLHQKFQLSILNINRENQLSLLNVTDGLADTQSIDYLHY